MSDARPPLRIEVGDTVIVKTGSKYRPSYEATVVKIARVWVTLQPEATKGEWSQVMFRMDSQVDRGDTGHRQRFVTREQDAWEARERAARDYLAQNLLRYPREMRTRWREDMVTLANLLRAHEGLDPL